MRNVFRPEPQPAPSQSGGCARESAGRGAWQPFTFRGVATFAGTSYQRLFWMQVFFAVLCTAAILWALTFAWTPVIRTAVRNLPNEAPVRADQLIYPPSAAPLLSESRHLALVLRPGGGGLAGGGAGAAASDVRIEFQPRRLRICSLFGCLVRPYPQGRTIYLTRQEAIPWWDAWEPILLGIVAIFSALFFLAAWTVLPTLTFLAVRLYAYFADRQLSIGGAWRLSAAAFLPGTLPLIGALVLYALGIADLIRFLLAIPGYLLIALIYLVFGPLKVQRVPMVPPPAANPFTATDGPGTASVPQ